MILSAIVAKSENNAIGRKNAIPWHLPADLKYFKQTTLDHPVIMGRKTFDSIGKPLPKRTNIVVTRNVSSPVSGIHKVSSISKALEFAGNLGKKECFIIGGKTIYEGCIELCQRLYITEVAVNIPDADTFFPRYDAEKWELASISKHHADEKNPYDYSFIILNRIGVLSPF